MATLGGVRRLVVSLGSVGLALALIGCGSQAARERPAPAATSSEQVPASLQFQARGLDSSTVNGADFAGEDVALWFWTPW